MRRQVLAINNIEKKVKKKQLIEDINFTAKEGEIIGLLGANGAGKTTIMKCITGLTKIDSGTVEICGEALTHKQNNCLKNVGAIIETPAFYNYMTGWNNLLQYMRMDKDSISIKRVEEVVSLVKLENNIHEKVKGYSLGMKQRLGVAQALLHNPKLLVLDEPMNGLDPKGVIDLRNLLQQLSKQGVTILISSHLLSEIEKIATRVLFIESGRLISDEQFEQISNTLEEKFLEIVS